MKKDKRKSAPVECRVRRRLMHEDRICREEFLTKDATPRSRERRRQMRVLNAVFQKLVIEGVLFTVDRSGDYQFFGHHGRVFPKMWRRRYAV